MDVLDGIQAARTAASSNRTRYSSRPNRPTNRQPSVSYAQRRRSMNTAPVLQKQQAVQPKPVKSVAQPEQPKSSHRQYRQQQSMSASAELRVKLAQREARRAAIAKRKSLTAVQQQAPAQVAAPQALEQPKVAQPAVAQSPETMQQAVQQVQAPSPGASMQTLAMPESAHLGQPPAQKVNVVKAKLGSASSSLHMPKLAFSAPSLNAVAQIRHKLFNKNAMASAFAVMGVGIFVGGALLTLQSLRSNERVVTAIEEATSGGGVAYDSISGQVAGVSGTTPLTSPAEEANKPNLANYTVDPLKPRLLSIPSRNIHARVTEVGVTDDNEIGVPASIHDVGWYNGSVQPGTGAGATVIDGHVSGFTQPGVFSELKYVQPGERVSIEKGDGEVLHYIVDAVETKSVQEVDVLDLFNPYQPGTEGLNLITCGGNFDAEAETYAERVIVYATRAQ